MEPYDYRRISPTALMPAFSRGDYTDIPFAKDIAAYLRGKGLSLAGSPWNDEAARVFAPFFESRFKAVSRILEEQRVTQVLELAAGLSPRGMDFSRRGVLYVDADLGESMALKEEAIKALLGNVPDRLKFRAASVLDADEFCAACAAFEEGPVAVTTEGLLRYLTFDEKKDLAANVHKFLSRVEGFWITTDIHLRKWAQRRRAGAERVNDRQHFGRELTPNYFDDLEHARAFFEECGFEVESRALLDGIRETMTSLAGADENLAPELIERQVFILRTQARDLRRGTREEPC